MPISFADKQALVFRYMPTLMVASNDVGLPVDPAVFVGSSALWSGSRPQLDNKNKWGLPAASGQRRPLVQRGSLSLSGLPLAGRGHHEVDEFWLDCAGWLASTEVAPSEDNRQANLDAIRSVFAGAPPVLRAEVCDASSWQGIGLARSTLAVLGLDGNSLTDTLRGIVVINYMLLFAGHRGTTTEVFGDDLQYGSGDFEGNWLCFSVFLSGDPELAPQQLSPRYAGYWRSVRGQSASFGENGTHNGFEVLKWDDVPRIGSSACVICSIGTHNLYPANVPSTPEGTIKIQSGSGGYGDTVIDDIAAFPGKAVKKNTATAAAVFGVTLAKIAAGAAIAGPFGALGGLVAGVFEAGPIGKAIGKDPGPPAIDPETATPPDGSKLKDPRDKVKTKATETQKLIVITADPDAVSDAEISQFLTFDGVIERRISWEGDSLRPVDRNSEMFWPLHDGANSRGYIGRWGVRCERDALNRRGGDILPDFRVEIIRHLMPHL